MESKRSKRRKRHEDETIDVRQNSQQSKNNNESESNFSRFYAKNFKLFLILPLLLIVASLFQIGYQQVTTGDFTNKGITLTGGVSITITQVPDATLQEIQQRLQQELPTFDVVVRQFTQRGQPAGIIIESNMQEIQDREHLMNIVSSFYPNALDDEDISTESTGASLGNDFFRQTIIAIIVAYIFMAIMVLLSFRTLIPSGLVILAALANVITTLAIFNMIGMKLSTGGIAAFLMLLGYSVDTDILLTSRVLRHKEGTVMSRTMSAMKTGITMSLTTAAAVLIGLFVSSSSVIQEIMTIVLIGLIIDIINTWIMNAPLLLWYVSKKRGDLK